VTPRSLSRGLAGLLGRRIGPADRHRAALHLLDWIGCAAAGALTPPGIAMREFAATMPGGRCRSFGGALLAGRDAALVNGALGNVLEMDDLYRTALLHPAPVVVPAALAMAEETGASAENLLDAVVRGYEAMIRVGRSVGPAHYRHFHNTATCGVFGSAAAAGSLLGLDEDQLVNAIGNAGTQASGFWQCRLEDTMSKQLHNGRAAQSGLIAAQLAMHQFTGAQQILEGPLGFYAGMCPDASPELLLQGAEGPWLIHGTSFKPWPACRHTHPAIDAVLALRDSARTRHVSRIVIETFADAVRICDNRDPRTSVEAKFSLQHAAATVLLRGAPILENFDAAAAADPVIAGLRRKVEVQANETLSRAYPARFGASVRIEFADGSAIQQAVSDALGDPENPLTESALAGKARMLLGSAGYAASAADDIVRAAFALTGSGQVGSLTQLMK